MNMRTFALLLAGFLFALSAATALLVHSIQPEASPAAEAFVRVQPAQTLRSPTGSWQTAGIFGAQYSEQYAQWSFKDDVTLEISDGAPVYAPMSGTILKAEPLEIGGSCVAIQCEGEIELELYPVYSLRIFEGSRMEQGDIIGSGRGSISLKARQNGKNIDPLILAEG